MLLLNCAKHAAASAEVHRGACCPKPRHRKQLNARMSTTPRGCRFVDPQIMVPHGPRWPERRFVARKATLGAEQPSRDNVIYALT